MALALVMLVTAWFRKRTFLGIAMALYGLSIFNLHYWGFGLPFIMGGAWYLVRAYRLSEKLKFAKAGEGSGPVTGPRARAPSRPSATPRRRLRSGPGQAQAGQGARSRLSPSGSRRRASLSPVSRHACGTRRSAASRSRPVRNSGLSTRAF